MALLAAIATGSATNFTSAGTWGVVDTNLYIQAAFLVAGTLAGSYNTGGTAITPGAITIDGLGCMVHTRTSTVGTFTASLYNVTDSATVAATEVTINTSDIQVTGASNSGGWLFLKFASAVTLTAGKQYRFQAKVSSPSSITLNALTSSDNYAFYARTTTTAAPTAGDDMIITKDWTAAGTGSAAIVTMDNTATTDFGSTPTAANALLRPGISICNGGTLSYGVSASTNYLLKLSNSIIVFSGGTLNIGTVGAEIPRNSTATLQFDCGTNVDYGLVVRDYGTFVSQGLSRTSGKNIYACKLNANESAGATVLDVDTDTGWLDNDRIAIASTTRTRTQHETGLLNGNASATELTVDGFGGAGGGLTSPKAGVSPTQAEVILLTRNVIITGASATLQSFVNFEAISTVDCDWTRFTWLGSATTDKRGINVKTNSGSATFHYCCADNFVVANSYGWFLGASNITGTVTVQYCTTYNVSNYNFSNTALTTGFSTIDNCIAIGTGGNAVAFNIVDVSGIFTNCTATSGAGQGMRIYASVRPVNTVNNLTSHSNNGANFTIGINFGVNSPRGTISNLIGWRANNAGLAFDGVCRDMILENVTLFGNSGTNISQAGEVINCTFKNFVLNGDSSFGTNQGLQAGSRIGYHNCKFIDCDFSTASGILVAHAQNDLFVGVDNTPLDAIFTNCKFGAANLLSGQTNLAPAYETRFQKYNQTAGSHFTIKRTGRLDIDTSVYNTASPSLKLTPSTEAVTALKHTTSTFKVNVNNGQTCTPTVYVRKSSSGAGDAASYSGAEPRLIVKQNIAMGIAADAVLDTMTSAVGSWEGLTGTTAAVTDDGVLEFVVDCDYGTANSFINVDDFAASVA
jgi:hypothetical protein